MTGGFIKSADMGRQAIKVKARLSARQHLTTLDLRREMKQLDTAAGRSHGPMMRKEHS
jgi:hypothetical protein